MTEKKKLAVAVTGASGAVYAQNFLKSVDGVFDVLYVVVSDTAKRILLSELGIANCDELVSNAAKSEYVFLDVHDLSAPIASGSHDFEGLVVVPCSMGTLGRAAAGTSEDLISRCADVCFKERKKAVFVVRETPLSLIHLKNMTIVTEAGGIILPASPAFYGAPENIDDLADFITDKIMRVLGCGEKTDGWRN